MVEMEVQAQDEDAVLKEVWNINEVDAKTELNSVQIESINKLQTLGVIFDNALLQNHLKAFMVLQKSKDRQSMKEFVDVVRAKREDFVNKGKGFFNGMLG